MLVLELQKRCSFKAAKTLFFRIESTVGFAPSNSSFFFSRRYTHCRTST